jgi:hypothetical protein
VTAVRLPDWFFKQDIVWRLETSGSAMVIRFPGGPRKAKWRSDCPACVGMPEDTDFWPSHDGSEMCQSGHDSHCTCDFCF